MNQQHAATAIALALLTGMSGISPAGADEIGLDRQSAEVMAAHPALKDAVVALESNNGVFLGDFGRLTVEVSSDPGVGVQLSKKQGFTLSVSLPFPESAEDGRTVADGSVWFANGNGSSTAVYVANDGSVAIHSHIEDARAPVEYAYHLGLPDNARIKVTDSDEVLILGENDESLFFIASPWAVDAAGVELPTRYEVRDKTLVQVVEHDQRTTYPVVADPSIGGFYMDRYQWNSAHDRLTLWPTLAGGTFAPTLVYLYGWPEVENAVGNQNLGMEQQFVCHCVGNTILWLAGQTWDLENWRGTVSDPWSMFTGAYPCNW